MARFLLTSRRNSLFEKESRSYIFTLFYARYLSRLPKTFLNENYKEDTLEIEASL